MTTATDIWYPGRTMIDGSVAASLAMNAAAWANVDAPLAVVDRDPLGATSLAVGEVDVDGAMTDFGVLTYSYDNEVSHLVVGGPYDHRPALVLGVLRKLVAAGLINPDAVLEVVGLDEVPDDLQPRQVDAGDETRASRRVARGTARPSKSAKRGRFTAARAKTPPPAARARSHVSDLVAVAYPDQQTAEAVRTKLASLAGENVIELADAVVVSRDDKGKVKLHQAINTTGAGAAGGPLWGGLIGMLFLAPLLGAAIGSATGGLSGRLTDTGVNDSFMKELGAKLTPGTAVLIVLVSKVTPDKVLPEIQEFGGEVLQTSLDDDAEERLRAALSASAPAAS